MINSTCKNLFLACIVNYAIGMVSDNSGSPPTIRRIIENVEVEFPDKLDDTDFPSWAFSSPGLGFPTSVSASSSSFAAANPMQ
ncbi:hypothetical protein RO3G_12645 [Rhizopus delemar RA 99-880]|uniref:Uncharacterized protein n=1 Tax=Rhizopus delemar (strain RA 99-880 / ATCC MYA-4621 / FGSC 9543 / NRRL 43880) TaxID=246409 RepID=I1CHK4_RHIO9|nr:hypothetical protein RO3G_12645 [Rhizopus delemar RA 99-880]|eukprot:EIE87934.1 hypothetical protein RO3G_12645 [Rhizopus delemar RA 99-880]